LSRTPARSGLRTRTKPVAATGTAPSALTTRAAAGANTAGVRSLSTAHAGRAGNSRPRRSRVPDADEHIGRNWFRRSVWNPACAAAELSARPRVHDLRHAHASWLLAGGADLQVVKERLGHASIVTTQKYLHTLSGATAMNRAPRCACSPSPATAPGPRTRASRVCCSVRSPARRRAGPLRLRGRAAAGHRRVSGELRWACQLLLSGWPPGWPAVPGGGAWRAWRPGDGTCRRTPRPRRWG
jgi:hypothetical protein